MGEVLHFRSRSNSGSGQRPAAPVTPRSHEPLPLWREVIGRILRETRHSRAETLAEVAGRAGISVPYLSEIERGRKEASSEVLAAAAGALGLNLIDLTAAAHAKLTGSAARLDLTSRPDDPRRPGTPTRPSGPVALAG